MNHAFISNMKISTHPYRSSTLLLGICLSLCHGFSARAADSSALLMADAGSLLQQSEQSIKPHLPATDALRLLNLPPPMTLPAQFRMNVRRVYFLGNTRISKSELYPAVQPFLNRSITALDIDKMKVAVAIVYRQTGWIVEVYLPQQTLDQNELTLQVVEDLRHSGKPPR